MTAILLENGSRLLKEDGFALLTEVERASVAGMLPLVGSAAGEVRIASQASGVLPLDGAASGEVPISGHASGVLTFGGAASGGDLSEAVAAGVLPLSGSASGRTSIPEGAVLARGGAPIDLILWRQRGRTAGLVEAVLDANQGLAARGAELTVDTIVRLPAPSAAAPLRQTIKLWGPRRASGTNGPSHATASATLQATTVQSCDAEPVDLIVWRNRGRTGGLVEAALGLNRGLAALGPELPGDITIQLPPDSTAPPVRKTVKLWG